MREGRNCANAEYSQFLSLVAFVWKSVQDLSINLQTGEKVKRSHVKISSFAF